MNLIVRFKRLIKKYKGKYQVWDTSAVSVWLDKLKYEIKENKIIIPEGVVHELSVGRRNYEQCRNSYNYIRNCNLKNFIVHVTSDKMRSWTVDEQIVAIVEEYAKKGYDVTLVTCDQDQAYKARLRGLNVQLLAGNRVQQKVEKVEEKRENKSVEPVKAVEKEEITNKLVKSGDEIIIPYIKKGENLYIGVKSRCSVYDNKGRRRIGKGNLIQIRMGDIIVYNNNKYNIQNISDTSIILKIIKEKIGSG